MNNPELDLSKTNPLDDKRVLLSLSLEDIETKANEIKDDLFDNLDIDKVFHLHRKYMESDSVMEIYWNTLTDAIIESEIN